jgi:hypothetical protein
MDVQRLIEDYRNADTGTRCCMYLWHRELRDLFASIDEESAPPADAVDGRGRVR